MDLDQSIYQLGLILYPFDLMNEKFLVKIRDCVVNLSEDHPLKRWLKIQNKRNDKKITEDETYLKGLVQSGLNLITDEKEIKKIIRILNSVTGEAIPLKLLKSYLYLLIGNSARSNSILKEIIEKPPVKNWRMISPSYLGDFAFSYSKDLIYKITNHPSDRTLSKLLLLYLKEFFNEKSIIDFTQNIKAEDFFEKLNLKKNKAITTDFIKYLIYKKNYSIKKEKYQLENQNQLDHFFYWVLLFANEDFHFLHNDVVYEKLMKLEENDTLWFFYVLESNKLVELYLKKNGKSFLSNRKFLRQELDKQDYFMMALYKLIEIGDIDQQIVSKVLVNLSYE